MPINNGIQPVNPEMVGEMMTKAEQETQPVVQAETLSPTPQEMPVNQEKMEVIANPDGSLEVASAEKLAQLEAEKAAQRAEQEKRQAATTQKEQQPAANATAVADYQAKAETREVYKPTKMEKILTEAGYPMNNVAADQEVRAARIVGEDPRRAEIWRRAAIIRLYEGKRYLERKKIADPYEAYLKAA